MRSFLFDEVPKDESQTGADTDEATPVPRPYASTLEEIIEYLGISP